MFAKSCRLMIVGILLLMVVSLAGCSKLVPLSGTVVLSDDGAPVPNGVICFTDGKNMARGNINADGSFEMGFVSLKDGMPPGKYKVYFFGVEAPSSGPDDSEVKMVMDAMGNMVPVTVMGRRTHLIDPKYDRPDTSGLEVEITKQTGTIEFKVDRFDPSRNR